MTRLFFDLVGPTTGRSIFTVDTFAIQRKRMNMRSY